MSEFDYDLFTIGAGSGGVRAARMAAGFGARVAIAEDRYLGGTCVNVGCVPKKLYVYAAQYGKGFEDARGFGWDSHVPQFSWSTLRDNKKIEIARLNTLYDKLLDGAGAQLFNGRGTIVDAHTVAVGGQLYTAEKILIATGGWPHIPEFPGSEHAVSSNEIFDLDTFPERLVIVGGGYIAVEFAGILNGLGVETHLVYRGPRDLARATSLPLLPRERAAREQRSQSAQDSHFRSARCTNALEVTLTDGSTLQADAVLYATGRKPHLTGLGLENVGVRVTEQGTIEVDSQYRTSEPSIFALGDVIGGMELTPVALAEGMAFARHNFGGQENIVDYDFIPTAVFCQPNIGTVGFTEEEARAKFGDIQLFKSSFRPMKHTLSGRNEKSFMKMIVETATDRVVGVHMVGEHAAEIIQGIGIAVKAGATKADFDATVGIHPSAAEEFVTMREPWTDN